MHRTVVVIAGVTRSGKSFLLNDLTHLCTDAKVVRMDDVRKQFWGDRSLTNAEGLLRNEFTRMMVKAKLCIERQRLILVEMPLLTRKDHQQAFVQMMVESRKSIQDIEIEEAEKEGRTVQLPKVNL